MNVSTKRVAAAIVLLALIVVAGVVFRSSAVAAGDDESSAAVSTPSPVSTASPVSSALPVNTVRAGDVRPHRIEQTFAGMLMARRDSTLSFDRSGRLASITKEEGDLVTAGEVIATLEIDDLAASQARASAELAAAEALLDEYRAGPRKQTIEAAAAMVGQLAAKLELAKATAIREQRLTDRGAGSLQTLDEATFAREEMTQQIRAARAELDLLNEGTRTEQLTAQAAVCASIRARLAEIEAERRDSQIVAPFDGVIRSRMVDEGVVVTPAMPIVELISHEVEARVGLPPAVADAIDPEIPVTVSLRTNACTGAVARVEPSVDLKTRTRGVYVKLKTNDVNRRHFIAGETVSVHLPLTDENAGVSATYWLPMTALARGGRGLWAVLVMPGDDDVAVCERRAVELLKTEGDYSLVQGMLQPGERVIVDGLHRITAGMTVSDSL